MDSDDLPEAVEDHEKAVQCTQEQTHLHAIAGVGLAETDAEQRKTEENRENHPRRETEKEKQRQRDPEKKKEKEPKETETNARRKKFEEMMNEIKAVSVREENGQENDEEPPEDEDYRRGLQKSMEEAAAAPMAADAPDAGCNGVPVQKCEAPSAGDLGNHETSSAQLLSKLLAEVSSLEKQLTAVTEELSNEKRLREMEEQRLECLRQGMQNREKELISLARVLAKSVSPPLATRGTAPNAAARSGEGAAACPLCNIE